MREDLHRDDEQESMTGGRFAAIMVLLSVLALFLYAAVLLASRTEGFRGYARDRLEKALGWPVQVERAYVSLGLNVVLEGIGQDGGLVAGRPGLQVGRLSVDISLANAWRGNERALRRLDIEDVYLAIAQDEQGQWQPAGMVPVVRRIAGWIGCELPAVPAEAAEPLVAAILFTSPLQLRNARVMWYGSRDIVLNLAGVEWRNDVLPVAGRKFLYRSFNVSQGAFRDGKSVDGLRLEFLQTPERTIVLRAETQAHRKAAADTAGPSEPVARARSGAQPPPDEANALREALSREARP